MANRAYLVQDLAILNLNTCHLWLPPRTKIVDAVVKGYHITFTIEGDELPEPNPDGTLKFVCGEWRAHAVDVQHIIEGLPVINYAYSFKWPDAPGVTEFVGFADVHILKYLNANRDKLSDHDTPTGGGLGAVARALEDLAGQALANGLTPGQARDILAKYGLPHSPDWAAKYADKVPLTT